ncbi:T9SS type A sorting domain-containing protein [Moheibacter sediminis]|uniref:Por secretion system C-terminal sorting domain-containing protein n=1 Tax=Moheibacter sediminis TaxID=1434700 RepID=A0A1W2BRJ3_9FLAO|nr:T9SS type A sorting domain-containing protein [Moheibacter sediminis]SMC75366.1 Por secretion system C-terminal sorting domain-containing protein [Moheibacter sediminis]
MKAIFTVILILSLQIIFAQDKMFTITSTGENISGHRLLIDHPLTNDIPAAVVIANYNTNPNGIAAGEENPVPNKPIFASYTGLHNKWYIALKDLTPMLENLSFNVYIADTDKGFKHIADTENSDPNYTYLDHPQLNGNPDNITLMTSESVENAHQGIWYFENRWSIYNENGSLFHIPSYSNIVVGGDDVQTFRHTVTAENIHPMWADVAVLDHPLLNGNPDAKFVFTHNWGQTGGTQIILDKALMAEYFDERWNISTTNLTDMTIGAMFDIYVYDQTMSVNDLNNQNEIKAYPNPVIDKVNFNSKSIIEKISIYNLSGKLISELNANADKAEINLSKLNAGIYIAKIQTKQGTKLLKLIKK